MFCDLLPSIAAKVPGVWRSRNGRNDYYWNPIRGDFKIKMQYIACGNRILTRLAKPFAKYAVLEPGYYGTKIVGYLVHRRTAERVLGEAARRNELARQVREKRAKRIEAERRARDEEIERAAMQVPILPALFSINRAAKRHRDSADDAWSQGRKGLASELADKKREYYELKGQTLHWLVREGTLVSVGFHTFHKGNVAEVLGGDGYRFHRPALLPPGIEARSIPEIESKQPEVDEVEEEVAVKAIRNFLRGRPEVEVYQWPSPTDRRLWRSDGWEDDEESESL